MILAKCSAEERRCCNGAEASDEKLLVPQDCDLSQDETRVKRSALAAVHLHILEISIQYLKTDQSLCLPCASSLLT